jgi:hypothetical protein
MFILEHGPQLNCTIARPITLDPRRPESVSEMPNLEIRIHEGHKELSCCVGAWDS